MSKVYLRELVNEDVNANYLKGFADDKVTEYLEVNGKALTPEVVIEYINAGKRSETYFMFAICIAGEDQQIGNLKIGPIDKKHGLSDLVAIIWDKNYWGKGLATEAIKQGNKLAFEKYNIRKLTGGIYSGNIGSIKAYTKAGWVIEGTMQNQYIVNGKFEDRVIVSCFNPFYELD